MIWNRKPEAPAAVDTAPVYLTELDAAKARETIGKIEQALKWFTGVVGVTGVGALIFTMVNVCLFAIHLKVSAWIAWMLDPIVSITLLGSLLTEGVFSAVGLKAGRWDWALRVFTGLATWTMNVWAEIFKPGTLDTSEASPAGIVLHSVAPVLVIIAGEALAYKRRQAAAKINECEITIRDYQAQCAAEERAAREAAAAEAREAREAERREKERAAREASEAAERESRERQLTAEREARERQQAAEREARERQQAAARESAEKLAELKLQQEREAREASAQIAREAAAAEAEKARIEANARLTAERLRLQAEADREAREAAAAEAREAREAAAQAAREAAEAQAKRDAEIREQIAAVWEKAHRENRERDARMAREAAEREAREAREARESDSREARGKVSREARDVPSQADREAEAATREALAMQRAQAEYKAAKLLIMVENGELASLPTHAEFAAEWGAGATWGGDRFRKAAAKLDRESGDLAFREAVELDVFEELTKIESGNAK